MANCIKTGANVLLLTHNLVLRADVRVHGHGVLVTGFNIDRASVFTKDHEDKIDFVVVADDYYINNAQDTIVLKTADDITVADKMKDFLSQYGNILPTGIIKVELP